MAVLFHAFVAWCQVRRHQRVLPQAAFTTKITQWPEVTLGRPRGDAASGKRPRVYRLSKLSGCRHEFEVRARQSVDWADRDLPEVERGGGPGG